MSKKLDDRLARVYQNPGKKQQLFDDWAATYDHDLVEDLGYVAHDQASQALMKQITDRKAHILDAGCGTGLVGKLLKDQGYENIYGSDYSSKMLEEAQKTQAYVSLTQHDLMQPVKSDIEYDAAIAVGVFSFNMPSAEHLVNITCALKLGGLAFITINGKAWVDVDWENKLEGFEQKWPEAKLMEIQSIDYLTAEGIDGRLLTLQRVM
ncbi:MAG: methyltransferase domain-containing protein [Pseudomonadota bacterium]